MANFVERHHQASSLRQLNGRRSRSASPMAQEQASRSRNEERRLSVGSIAPRDDAPLPAAERNLEWWDVAALIINKMIGTGIFTGPFLTMQLTRNKGQTMAFWVVGFVYTLLSTWLYLEYARDLPYTGGEMVYLDFVFRRPRLLMYTWYTFYFVILYNTCTNSMQFARYVVVAADVTNNNPDRRLLCFIAVVITSLVCLILYFDSLTSRYANASTALAKVVLLLALFSSGCWYVSHHGSNQGTWSTTYDVPPALDWPGLSWSQGLLVVFFSYHGWENATFVTGEIPRYKVLRTGFVVAVVVVGVLYTSLAAVFCAAFPSDLDGSPEAFQNYMAVFFSGSDDVTNRATQASAILIALSAAGNMISVAYTAVRVKQIIGWANILPLSRLWRRTDLSRHIHFLMPRSGRDAWQSAVNRAFAIRRGTPEGGILLHYIGGVVLICLTQAFTDLQTAITASGSVLIYGHFFYEAVAGFGFAFFFKPNERREEIPIRGWHAPRPAAWFAGSGAIILGSITTAVSLFVVAIELREGMGRNYFYTILAITVVSLLYWLVFIWHRPGSPAFAKLGMSLSTSIHGLSDRDNASRQCSECADHRGQSHRHREDGYHEFSSIRHFNTDKLTDGQDIELGGFSQDNSGAQQRQGNGN